ncbi:unnamed protein product [Tilletia controversa]|nr:unnamed protein product [Tilletia caries]CAD6951533.1 unnamed protein product [Tilletia controversa]CAD6956773.1 unnamed protein product [Tilletia controversa]CAD6973870.1 unnamed protein product [Tilletia controversa]CAD7063650.1 unnamed protein product [Tilletia caries]
MRVELLVSCLLSALVSGLPGKLSYSHPEPLGRVAPAEQPYLTSSNLTLRSSSLLRRYAYGEFSNGDTCSSPDQCITQACIGSVCAPAVIGRGCEVDATSTSTTSTALSTSTSTSTTTSAISSSQSSSSTTTTSSTPTTPTSTSKSSVPTTTSKPTTSTTSSRVTSTSNTSTKTTSATSTTSALPTGAACTANSVCGTGYCRKPLLSDGVTRASTGTCDVKKANGSKCYQMGGCISGVCSNSMCVAATTSSTTSKSSSVTSTKPTSTSTATSSSTKTTTSSTSTLLPSAASCTSNALCSSGYCRKPLLSDGVTRASTGVCDVKKASGTKCYQNDGCISGKCTSSKVCA